MAWRLIPKAKIKQTNMFHHDTMFLGTCTWFIGVSSAYGVASHTNRKIQGPLPSPKPSSLLHLFLRSHRSLQKIYDLGFCSYIFLIDLIFLFDLLIYSSMILNVYSLSELICLCNAFFGTICDLWNGLDEVWCCMLLLLLLFP